MQSPYLEYWLSTSEKDSTRVAPSAYTLTYTFSPSESSTRLAPPRLPRYLQNSELETQGNTSIAHRNLCHGCD